ncbi:MAG TPA: MarR family transcriptional regulator [Gaiellaceae bacterium]|nr:MarR family transcriptional regulator [Gaiellaceae bacterium]
MTTSTTEAAAALHRFGLERDRLRSALARATGLTSSDLDALEHLEAAGPLTQKALGERVLLSSGAVTMLVDRLERAGWVRRVPHPHDRRAALVELSQDPPKPPPAALDAYHARIRALTRDLDVDARDQLATFLGRAADAAEDAVVALGHPVSAR